MHFVAVRRRPVVGADEIGLDDAGVDRAVAGRETPCDEFFERTDEIKAAFSS